MNGDMKTRRMRLTHEPPQGMYEYLHNAAFVKNREVFLRGMGEGEEDITLCDYVAIECKKRCGAELSDVPTDEFAECMGCDCPIGLLYGISIGAAEMREKLKRYEDAEAEGRLVALPCKVGDTVYEPRAALDTRNSNRGTSGDRNIKKKVWRHKAIYKYMHYLKRNAARY